MKLLSHEVAKANRSSHVQYENFDVPEKVIQIGEGNFLRGFVDWMIHTMNKQRLFNGKVVAIQPTPHGKVVPLINEQEGLYTLSLRGIQAGKQIEKNEIITSISRGINPYSDWDEVLKVIESEQITFMFSNTTEAGLTYMKEDYDETKSPLSFPGKVTALLYHRYNVLGGTEAAGLTIIPCELVQNNGELLKKLVLKIANDWSLPLQFIKWVKTCNEFCNTLVDRIVTGYPHEEIVYYEKKLQYKDQLLTTGEPYHLFAIDASDRVAEQLPFQEAGLNVKWGDITPYEQLKVRLLNGTHTMMFAASYLSNVDTVLEAIEDPILETFIKTGLYEEILPVVPVNDVEKNEFVNTVIERFLNPYNKHALTDIGMNAIFKFKTRLIPSLLDYVRLHKKLPKAIVFSLAALFVYYRPVRKEEAFLIGKRHDDEYVIRDQEEILTIFQQGWQMYDGSEQMLFQFVRQLLKNKQLWNIDLTTIPSLQQTVCTHVQNILNDGMKQAIENVFVSSSK